MKTLDPLDPEVLRTMNAMQLTPEQQQGYAVDYARRALAAKVGSAAEARAKDKGNGAAWPVDDNGSSYENKPTKVENDPSADPGGYGKDRVPPKDNASHPYGFNRS